MATGYATLYGDMAGGFAVIKDLDRKQFLVFELARWRNEAAGRELIPEGGAHQARAKRRTETGPVRRRLIAPATPCWTRSSRRTSKTTAARTRCARMGFEPANRGPG